MESSLGFWLDFTSEVFSSLASFSSSKAVAEWNMEKSLRFLSDQPFLLAKVLRSETWKTKSRVFRRIWPLRIFSLSPLQAGSLRIQCERITKLGWSSQFSPLHSSLEPLCTLSWSQAASSNPAVGHFLPATRAVNLSAFKIKRPAFVFDLVSQVFVAFPRCLWNFPRCLGFGAQNVL